MPACALRAAGGMAAGRCCEMLMFGMKCHPVLWTESTSYGLVCRNGVTFTFGFYEFSAQESVFSQDPCLRLGYASIRWLSAGGAAN